MLFPELSELSREAVLQRDTAANKGTCCRAMYEDEEEEGEWRESGGRSEEERRTKSVRCATIYSSARISEQKRSRRT